MKGFGTTGSPSLIARNQNNARKSTGPKTAEGKAIVSRNAVRHGATSKPDPALVAAWARVILDRPDLGPAGLLGVDPRVPVAMALAEAEVSLLSASVALESFETRRAAPRDVAPDLVERSEDLMLALLKGEITMDAFQIAVSVLRGDRAADEVDTGHPGKRHELLRRYMREACGYRKRAFANWIDCMNQSALSPKEIAQKYIYRNKAKVLLKVVFYGDRQATGLYFEFGLGRLIAV